MLNSLACCIDQIVEIITLLADSTINISFTFYKTKFAIVDNQLQLLNKTGTLQIMQLLQFFSHTSPWFHIICKVTNKARDKQIIR